MPAATDRLLTTHAGSLPRPDVLLAVFRARQGGERNADELARVSAAAVREAVEKQVACGIDVVSDGEMSKISYVGYVAERLNGMSAQSGGNSSDPASRISPVVPTAITFPDIVEHPDYAAYRASQGGGLGPAPVCTGPISYGDRAPLDRDIACLTDAARSAGGREVFMNAASPGVIAMFIPSTHYRNDDDYIADLARAMRTEYEAIHRAGIFLQIDCPDLAMSWHMRHASLTPAQFRKIAHRNIEAVNYATANIPPAAMRLHICWGNYHGPHTYDLPVAELFEVIRRSRPRAILFEGANPRHEHEWEDWQNADLPDDMVLVPGVIDSTTNFVEHPRLVAQRLKRYADIVGRERVMAGTDCGFGTFALRHHQVFPSIVWSKLKALSAGAQMASDTLWGRAASAVAN
ncbi:MAG: cobalamin-independent methionine synthase II family protein [Hyphomicrobiales bacterium]|nr:cobalamin-independent methionine synthase II family protein [Hyphomicrobiales bacterium]